MKLPLINLKAQYESIKKEIDEAIKRVIDSAKFIGGEDVLAFEKEFASYCGKKFAIGTSSGTTALHLALLASLKEKGEVITVPNTFTATTAAIHHAGGKIKFVDVDEYYLIDVSKINPNSETKAIIPVHLYGQAADMKEILDIAKEKNLVVIEDAAQAHGAEYRGKRLPVAKTGVFSFYPAKNLGAYGDAGCVVTDDEEIAQKIRQLRDHGRADRVKSKYEHSIIGFNYRLDSIQAAVLRVKLKHLDEWNEKKRKKAELYNKLLLDIPEIETPKIKSHNKHVYYVYTIKTKERDSLQEFLAKNGISTQMYYPIPLHLQEAYRFLGYKKGDFPKAEQYANEVLSLPMYPELTEEQISFICKKIKEFFKK